MQKKLIAVAVAGALGAPAVALAQNATVNVYGRLYMELGHAFQGNQVDGTTMGTQPLVDAQILQTPGSALGFRGEEKLGGGMSAWFQCESTMDYRGFEQDGLCGRNSAVGLRGGFGNIFVGVWDTPFKRVQDPVGGGDTGLFGTAFVLMGNSTTVAGGAPANQGVFKRRQSGSINYDSPNFGGFQLSAATTVQNSQTAVANSATGSKPRIWSFSGRYATGPVNIYAAYEQHKDVVAGSTRDDDGWVIGGSYTIARNLKLGGLFSRQKWDGAGGTEGKVNVWHFGVDWMFSGPHGIRAAYSAAGDVKGNTTAGLGTLSSIRPAAITAGASGDTGAQLWQIRYVHALSKRTELTAGYVKIKNDRNARYRLGGLDSAAYGNDPSAIAIGLDHRF